MKTKVREFYRLAYVGRDIKNGGVGPFSDLNGAINWLISSGIKSEKMELYRCEVWDDGSRDWHIEYIDEEKGA